MFKNFSLTTRVSAVLVSITLLVIVGICFGGWLIFREITTSPFRKVLPATAKEIHEWSWHEPGPLAQDHFYMLTAKISEQEFDKYVHQLDLNLYNKNNDSLALDWYAYETHTSERFDWWGPAENSDEIYTYSTGSYWEYAKYENGYLFLIAFNI